MLDVKKLLSKMLESKEDNLTGGYTRGAWKLYRRGNIVFLQVITFAPMPKGSFDLGVTIPEKYRPLRNCDYNLSRRGSTAAPVAMSVRPDGSVICYNYGAATTADVPYAQLIAWFID